MSDKYCVCNNGYVCNNCFLEEIKKQANQKKESARTTNAIEDLLIELGCGCDGHEDECDLLTPNCSVMKAEVCYNNLLLSYRKLEAENERLKELLKSYLENVISYAEITNRSSNPDQIRDAKKILKGLAR